MQVNTNIGALSALRNLSVNDAATTKSIERLSSGFRINRAGDDAAGLVISEGLRSQIGGLKVAMRNAQDGISVSQTAEGALNEVHSILQRMRDLAVQAVNASNDPDARTAANNEITELKAQITRIGTSTRFGEQYLLDGSFGATPGQRSSFVAAAANFGGDEVIGVSESDVNCPAFESPLRTLHLDGTPVEASALEPFFASKVRILGAVAVPIAVAAAVIFLLATFRLSIAGLYHSVVDTGRRAR